MASLASYFGMGQQKHRYTYLTLVLIMAILYQLFEHYM